MKRGINLLRTFTEISAQIYPVLLEILGLDSTMQELEGLVIQNFGSLSNLSD